MLASCRVESPVAGQFFFLHKKEALEAFAIYDRFVFECVQLDMLLNTSRVRGVHAARPR